MQALNKDIKLYIGSQIEYESERKALRQIVDILNSDSLPAVIIANVNLFSRQIDIVVATERKVLVVEAKGVTRPLRGTENGSWEFKAATGEWKTTGRNYYQQALNSKNALRDSMSSYSNQRVNYPEAALIFVPRVPEGSEVPRGDFKVKVGDMSLLESLNTYTGNSDWSLDRWRDFAEHHNLIKVDILESAFDSQLAESEALLKRYKTAFRTTYAPQTERLVPFPCHIGEVAVTSGEVAQQQVNGKDILIVGPSGCGKSMLAKKIGLLCIESGNIPVIFEAKYFKGEFSRLLNQEATLLDAPSINTLFEACKRLGKSLIIILDGYNECSKTLRQRLSRCLRATAIRYCTGLIVTSQKTFNELQQLNLEVVSVPEPDIDVKKAIAGFADDEDNSSRIEDLLDLARSGLEADIIGQIGNSINPRMSRYALFDTYIRKRLGDLAQDGIRILSHIASYFSVNVTFSMTVRDLDRLLEKDAWPSFAVDQLLATNLLKRRVDRISFGHEIYLNVFSAEASIRECGTDSNKILSMISSPRHANYRTLIVGGIDNTNVLNRVLKGIEDEKIIISCVAGECGEYAREWAEDHYRNVLQHIRQEAKSVRFRIDEKAWMHISADTQSLLNWNIQDQAFTNALSHLLSRGKYLDEIFEIVGLMDEHLRESFTSLAEEAQSKRIALRSGLFAAGLDDQNSAIAISRIIAWIDFNLSPERRRDSAVIRKWIQYRLTDCEISNGQVFMILKLCRHIWEKSPLTKVLPTLIRERWAYAPYHLRLNLLDAARCSWDCSVGETDQIIEVLNGIETNNIFLSTSIIDALKSLGALEEVDYTETVKSEIEQVLSNPDDPQMWSLARSIYNSQFDHPYDSVYCEVLHELQDSKRKELLSIAVRGKDDFRMFVTCMLVDLAAYRDKESGKHIEHWTELPPRDDPMPQDSVGVFVVSHIILGYLGYPLPHKSYDKSSEDNAMLACGDVYYWINRHDLSWNERKEHLEQAWNILLRHELGVSLGVIRECESTPREGLNRLSDTEPIGTSIIESFPDEISDICRYALSNLDTVTQHARRRWVKEEEILDYAVHALGVCGKATDLILLREMVDHECYGRTAMDVVQRLEKRLISEEE